MVHLIDIRKVEVGPKYLTARVRIAMSAPLMTSEDLEGTTRVYRLFPHIIEHVCLGDNSETFKDVMGDTEIAHLLEHVTVEILAQTNIAGNVTYGRTFAVEGEARTYDIEFPCPDDALVIGALSSAAWILQWAYSGGGDPAPDVYATIDGLVNLVESLPEPPLPQPSVREYVVEGDEAIRILTELGLYEPASEPAVEDEPWVDDEIDEPDWLIAEEQAIDYAAVEDVEEAADEVVVEEVEEPKDVFTKIEDMLEVQNAAFEEGVVETAAKVDARVDAVKEDIAEAKAEFKDQVEESKARLHEHADEAKAEFNEQVDEAKDRLEAQNDAFEARVANVNAAIDDAFDRTSDNVEDAFSKVEGHVEDVMEVVENALEGPEPWTEHVFEPIDEEQSEDLGSTMVSKPLVVSEHAEDDE